MFINGREGRRRVIRRRKRSRAESLDECVAAAIVRTREALDAFDAGDGKPDAATLAKLVSIIGELRSMSAADSGDTKSGVIILPAPVTEEVTPNA